MTISTKRPDVGELLRERLAQLEDGGCKKLTIAQVVGLIGFCEFEAIPTNESPAPDPYREAIDEALIVRHLGVAKGDAEAELETVISWEVSVALDPRVSSSAQALIDQGRAESPAPQPPVEGLREALERIKYSLDCHLNDTLCEMNSGYDDSVVGFNEAWDIVRSIFKDHLATLASPSLTAGPWTDDRLMGLVDWVYLHATEGQIWPSTKTRSGLIASALIGPPSQADADKLKPAPAALIEQSGQK